ncbi:MAG: prepilin-type N-terminal cleavage/methylation domain-containing protein [Candidatus Marinimicrobia bacterium]|nr:prepilin-type N-terminal cleavage/methylation domain-containing protein [Candidatus Neomarinimicrobiota bacterium]
MFKRLKSENGFTFVEVMVGVVIVAIASIGIMMGTVHAKGELRALQIEELAVNQLSNYLEYWKGRVATKTFSSVEKAGDYVGKQIFLIGEPNSDGSVKAKLYYDISNEPSNYNPAFFDRYRVEAWIEWDNYIFNREVKKRSKRLETVMIVFKF